MYCIRIVYPEVLMSSADRYSRYYSLITGQGAGVIYSRYMHSMRVQKVAWFNTCTS
jgi:hypothetical protein